MAQSVATALEALGHETELVVVGFDLTVIERLKDRSPFVVFNLVDSIHGDCRLGHLACAALEHLGVPFTGAGATAYIQSTSKLLTKTLLQASGLPTPRFWHGDAPAGVRTIVKSVYEHASYGMDQGSVVDGGEASAERQRRQVTFGGTFFCEEYIDGREFNVSLVEIDGSPHVLPIPEIDFTGLPNGTLPIVDYAAKWDPEDPAYHLTPRQFGLEGTDPALAAKLTDLSLACWNASGLRGYARVDFRVDAAGNPFILEFNANPCISRDAGFAAALAASGYSYDQGVGLIVDAALQRPVH